jgi:pimeloyl-ACP methyl ester carboxylesterase
MSVVIYRPEADTIRDGSLAVLQFNQIGATTGEYSDGRRDAEHLAKSIGLTVIGVDRPGTHSVMPRRGLTGQLATPYQYVHAMAKVGEDIQAKLHKTNIATVIAVGRSAAGTAALALAETRTVGGLHYVGAAEPPGSMEMTVRSGAKHYKQYLVHQAALLADEQDTDIIRPQPHGLHGWEAMQRSIGIADDFLIDRHHNKRLWATNAVAEYVVNLAAAQPEMDVTLEYAQESMVITPEAFDELQTRVAEARKPDAAPFSVERSENTVHTSYDNRDYWAEHFVGPIVERALQET